MKKESEWIVGRFIDQLNEASKEKPKFGKWKVSKSGDMVYDKGKYDIYHDQLSKDWILHLSGKVWIDWNEFIPAYLQALENAGIEYIKMRVFYKRQI